MYTINIFVPVYSDITL